MKKIETTNKIYHYEIVNNEVSNNNFNTFITKIIELSKNRRVYMGMDLEFNSKTEIGSFQLNFNYNKKKDQYMYIINYDMLSDENKKLFFNNILLNKKIKKIMHGSHGLDLPTLIFSILKDEKYILKFVKSYYDIKFLCNYIAIKEQLAAKACGKYDMLYKFNIITEEKYIELENNKNSQEAIKDKYVNIKLLSPEFEKYMIYDVIYIIEVYKFFKIKLKDIYKLILEFNQLIVLDKLIYDTNTKYDVKYDVFNFYYKYKNLYDGININFIYLNDKNIQINTYFEQIFKKYNEQTDDFIINNKIVYNIVDLKTFILFYFKVILINYLIKKNIKIYKNKKNMLSNEEKNDIVKSYNELYNFIEKNKFNKILNVFKNFEKFISILL